MSTNLVSTRTDGTTSAVSPNTRRMRNTNAWDTRSLVTMALLAAIAALLSFIEVGSFFGFMKYDASNVPAIIVGFLMGPVQGVVVGIIGSLVHAIIASDPWGGLMNGVAVAVFVLVSAGIHHRSPSTKTLVMGLAVACAVNPFVMAGLGLVVTPVYTGWPVSQVLEMIVPIVLPFNLFKGIVNSVLAYALLKPVQKMYEVR